MQDFTVRAAVYSDIGALEKLDKHIRKDELFRAVEAGRVYAAFSGNELCGWLRYNLFWDNTPFLNMLFVLEPFRGRGAGSALLSRWEEDMRKAGFFAAMTSTAAAETAQHFYAKNGYTVCGGFFPEGEGYELLLSKKLK